MAKAAYIGVTTAVPTYSTQSASITESNIGTYFTVTNGSYYFAGSGSTFTTNNGGVNSSTASTTLTAKYDMSSVSFSYSYSSESGWDKFTLIVAGTTVADGLSGSTTTKTWSGSIKSGDTIEFKYVKDSSSSSYDDQCTFSNMTITMQTQTGTEQREVARKVKNMYIGVPTEVPSYGIGNIPITASNISTHFTVSNGTYYFAGSDSTFTSNNVAVKSSTATTTLTALNDTDVSFSYTYSTEAGYDKFTIVFAGTTILDGVSGSSTTPTPYSGHLAKGQTIEFTYTKDGSTNGNSDKCTFSDMTVTGTTQIGTETKEVARKVKKGYIGVGGVARLFFSSGLHGNQTLFADSSTKTLIAVKYANEYWVVGGQRYDGSTYYATIAYTKDLAGSWTTNDVWSESDRSSSSDESNNRISCVDYGNGYWVAGGYNVDKVTSGSTTTTYDYGKIAYATSPDGTWTTKTVIEDGAIADIVYANGYWAAAYVIDASNDEIGVVYATDPTGDWTNNLLTEGVGVSLNLNCIGYGDGYWVVGGYSYSSSYNAQIHYGSSISGTWASKTLWNANESGSVRSIKYGNGYWVAGGYYANSGTYKGRIAYSTSPGGTWTKVDIWDSDSVNSVEYANGLWIAVGEGKIAYATSPDGTWTVREIDTTVAPSYVNDIAFGNDTYVIVGDGGGIAYSSEIETLGTAQ